ncbi:MAG: MFS transporter [Verrucomicrobia bacterium]|nr:MFS transporter [Verrucomicrobiota bacterium]
MNRKNLQIAIIYLAALIQGTALVTFPAAGTMLTSPHGQNLTPAQYGFLFIPMNIAAIISSFLAGNLSGRIGLRPIFICGLLCNAVSMTFFASTQLILTNSQTVFGLMLLALLFMGLGFGTCLTILNAYVAAYFPKRIPTALTALHSLLGIGTAIAPLLFDFFVERKSWWFDPILLGGLFFFFTLSSWAALDARRQQSSSAPGKKEKLGTVFKLFCAMVFLYGICETVFGNWSTILLTTERGLSLSQASLALSIFWATVTLGRIGITIGSFWVRPKWIYIFLPLAILLVYLFIPMAHGGLANMLMFAAAGLACSGMLPLSISLDQKEYPTLAAFISGRLVPAYMLGYCVAAYGVGEIMKSFKISLESIYFYTSFIALIMVVMMPFLFKRIKKS